MKPEYDEDYLKAIQKMDSEEVQGGNILATGQSGLDWDNVLDRVRLHLADVKADRGLVNDPVGLPAWLTTATNQARAILVTMDRAEWEDHLEMLIRPQLVDLLETLVTAGKEVKNGSDPAIPPG